MVSILVVGDDETSDILGARNAGMQALRVTGGLAEELSCIGAVTDAGALAARKRLMRVSIAAGDNSQARDRLQGSVTGELIVQVSQQPDHRSASARAYRP